MRNQEMTMDSLQTQQKNSISQKQEISWQAKLTSDYGHMYVTYVCYSQGIYNQWQN